MSSRTDLLPKALLGAAIVLGAYIAAESFSRERRSARSAPREASVAERDAPATAAPVQAPAEPPSSPAVPPPSKPVAQPDEPERALPEAQASAPELAPCAGDVRIAGTTFAGGKAPPMVLFSGADVRFRGVRSIGGQVAGRTVMAIYPTSVVLRDTQGNDCFVRMSSPRAREVADSERRARDRRAIAKAREDERERIAARKARARKKAAQKAK